MLKVFNLFFVTAAIAASSKVLAIGVGLSLFGPTGITIKHDFEGEAAIDGTLGFDSNSHYEMQILQGTYLLNVNEYIYFGFGARITNVQHKAHKYPTHNHNNHTHHDDPYYYAPHYDDPNKYHYHGKYGHKHKSYHHDHYNYHYPHDAHHDDHSDDEIHEDYTITSARIPIGGKFRILSGSEAVQKIEFFGELALLVDLYPKTAAGIDFAIGARYFF